jgi:2-hydroxy-3-keto-5-methylthiopentenyl-1-phosphate phosphatase
MSILNKENIIQKTLESILETQPLFKKELEWCDEITPHIFFGDVLDPYIIKLLNKNVNQNELKAIFDFFEQMASSNDLYVQQVLATTVLERLGDDDLVLKKG